MGRQGRHDLAPDLAPGPGDQHFHRSTRSALTKIEEGDGIQR
jgi:hypothetical protein